MHLAELTKFGFHYLILYIKHMDFSHTLWMNSFLLESGSFSNISLQIWLVLLNGGKIRYMTQFKYLISGSESYIKLE